MAAFTLAAISGGMAVILCAVLACSAPLAMTSASSLPSMTALQPGIQSPHLSTFAIAQPPVSSHVLPDHWCWPRPDRQVCHADRLVSVFSLLAPTTVLIRRH